MILDATAGYRIMWRTGKNPFRLYHKLPDLFIDIRKKVRPSIIADLKYAPFRSGIFDRIYFDPPHENFGTKIKNKPESFEMYDRFGSMTLTEFKKLCIYANIEFHRILKPNGQILAKICDRHNRLSILKRNFTNFTLLRQFDAEGRGKVIKHRSKKRYTTYWLVYLKNEEVNKR